jgi:large subunit ribosomal protein L13e
VHAPTQKYSAKVRLGKGFTGTELAAAKLHPAAAQKLGIAVDWRRRNRCEESLAVNVERLELYKKSLIMLKKGETAEQVKGVVMPYSKPETPIQMMEVTKELKEFKAFTAIRVARHETKIAGYRISVENRKKNE